MSDLGACWVRDTNMQKRGEFPVKSHSKLSTLTSQAKGIPWRRIFGLSTLGPSPRISNTFAAFISDAALPLIKSTKYYSHHH